MSTQMGSGNEWCMWCCVFFLALRLCRTELLYFDRIESRKSPSTDFAQHSVIKPKMYTGREKREISTTGHQVDGGHIHDLMVGYSVNGTNFVLDLRLNQDLIPKHFFTRYQHGGQNVVNHATHRDVEVCQYQGHVRGRRNSWAAISTCHGLSGMVFDGEELHYLQPGSEEHFFYRHSDIKTNQTCGFSGTLNHIMENDDFNKILRFKRSTGVIRGPYNANRQSRYVELVLVVDNKEYKELGESLLKVNNHCKEIANIINALYQPLNIFIALVGVVVWTEMDEISLSHNGDTTLTNFLHYRRERLVKEHPNDNAQLLTRWQFEGGVVGKALKGPICTFEFSGGVSMDHSSVVGLVATTVAHEMGHNLGMEHDTAECNCPSERCIMAPSSSSLSPTQWSSCSLDYLAVAFDHGMDYCLRNKPTSLFDSPVCGNGFVEAGEQCDCGLKDRCDNPCCNATTCMLFSNASCATGECCNLKTCRPKNAGSECRSTHHECDLPEFCTGQGEYCPEDVFKMDGEMCDRGKAFCYQGSCRTHTDQCKLLWGPSGKSSDTLCYQMNTNGTRHGNCGFNKMNRSYIKCNDENIYCGMLHCRHLNERLEFGMESVSILSHSFINSGGSIIPCRTAIVDLGLNEVDPGLAPDGAKCGDGKMCLNQKCMAVGSLRHQTGACPMDCNGNGVCNSRGHCHCKVGFSPPHCDYPGSGGSQDSGPASDPNAQRDIMTALYVIFLGIVPLCALVAMFVYYTRQRVTIFWWKKTSLASDSSISNSEFKSSPHHINREDSSPSHHSHALEISSPLDCLQSSDNAHASLLTEAGNCAVQILGPNAIPIPVAAHLQNNLFGHFKGFSITPIATNPVNSPPPPVKAAPPPPRITTSITSQSAKQVSIRAPLDQSKNNICPGQDPLQLTKNNVLNHTKPNSSLNTSSNSTSILPLFPIPKSNSNLRPLISCPVLDTTTCTVKELHSVRNPTRPAPQVPCDILPATSVENISDMIITNKEVKQEQNDAVDEKVRGGSYPSLTRLASFMLRQNTQENKKNKGKIEKSKSLPKTQVHGMKANKLQIDRETLRNIQISNPIPQQEMEIPDNLILEDLESAKQVVMRAQSLRDNSTVKKRTEIPGFGSMRSGKRPTSIPPSIRPTSPPPRPPPPPHTSHPPEDTGIIGLPGYQNPTEYCYDDCFNLLGERIAPLANIDEESPTNDNIYAIIEESPPVDIRHKMRSDRSYPIPRHELNLTTPLQNSSKFDYSLPTFSEYKTPKPIENSTSAGSIESVGLLSEIVSEIQARNVESIYSASAETNLKEGYRPNNISSFNITAASSGFPDVLQDKVSADTFLGTYVNASNVYRPTGSVYSNMSTQQSSSSSTCSSNGYLSPTPRIPTTAISTNTTSISKSATTALRPLGTNFQNKPVLPITTNLDLEQENVNNTSNKNVNSFCNYSCDLDSDKGNVLLLSKTAPKSTTEGYKPYSSSLHRSLGPFAASFKNTDAVKLKNEPLSVHTPHEKAMQACTPAKPGMTSRPTNVPARIENVESSSKNSKQPNKVLKSPPVPRNTSITTSQIHPASLPQQSISNISKKPLFNRSLPPQPTLKQSGSISRQIPTSSPKVRQGPSSLPNRTLPSNSPDLVSSCKNGSNSNNSPDVLGMPQGDKQVKLINSIVKRDVCSKQPQLKLAGISSSTIKSASESPKLGTVNSPLSLPNNSVKGTTIVDVGKGGKSSNVASLQQKFETVMSKKDKPVGNVTPRTLSQVASKNSPTTAPSTSLSSFKK